MNAYRCISDVYSILLHHFQITMMSHFGTPWPHLGRPKPGESPSVSFAQPRHGGNHHPRRGVEYVPLAMDQTLASVFTTLWVWMGLVDNRVYMDIYHGTPKLDGLSWSIIIFTMKEHISIWIVWGMTNFKTDPYHWSLSCALCRYLVERGAPPNSTLGHNPECKLDGADSWREHQRETMVCSFKHQISSLPMSSRQNDPFNQFWDGKENSGTQVMAHWF